MKLIVLSGVFSVCKLKAGSPMPQWVDSSSFLNVTNTDDELSIVCISSCVPDSIKAEHGWKIIKILGPLDFGLTGILSSIASPLADAKISIFAISTFDTDYVLIKEDKLNQAKAVLEGRGFEF